MEHLIIVGGAMVFFAIGWLARSAVAEFDNSSDRLLQAADAAAMARRAHAEIAADRARHGLRVVPPKPYSEFDRERRDGFDGVATGVLVGLSPHPQSGNGQIKITDCVQTSENGMSYIAPDAAGCSVTFDTGNSSSGGDGGGGD